MSSFAFYMDEELERVGVGLVDLARALGGGEVVDEAMWYSEDLAICRFCVRGELKVRIRDGKNRESFLYPNWLGPA